MNSDIEEHCGRLLDSAREELYHLINNYFSGFGEKVYIIVRSVRRDGDQDGWITSYGGVRHRYKQLNNTKVDITLALPDDYELFDKHIDIDDCVDLPSTVAYVSYTGNNRIFLDMRAMRDEKILMSM